MVVALAVGLSASTAWAAPKVLKGSVYTEAKASSAVVRVWALGEAVVADPTLLLRPVAEAATAPGSGFSVSLPAQAPWPVRVEVSAPGHVAVCLEVLFPEQAVLPPAWLPQGERLEILLRRGGKAAGEALSWGTALEPFVDHPPMGRFYPCVARAQAADGRREVRVPPQALVTLVARDGDGAWGRWQGMGNRTGHATVTLKTAVTVVRVVDQRGEPVAGARVAAGEAPPGAAAVSDGEGRATVPVPAEGQWSLVALAPGLAGRTVRQGGPPAGGVEVQLTPAEEVEVRWSGPRGQVAVLPTWLPEALTGGAPQVVGGGHTHLPLVGAQKGLGAFGQPLLLWAPGFVAQQASVAEGSGPLEVALKPAGGLAVRVTDRTGRPRSGVPVWAWVPGELPAGVVMRGLPSEPPQRRWLPEGVTDGTGSAQLSGLPAGSVRASARAQGFPEVASPPVELAAGQRRELTLVLTSGVTLACSVTDAQGVPLEGARVEVFRRQEQRERPRIFLRGDDKPWDDLLGGAATDGEGRAVVAPLPVGAVRVWVSLPGFVTARLDAEVGEAGGELGPVMLTPGVAVRGRVVDEHGAAVASAQVFSGPAGSPMLVQLAAHSDGEGFFTIADVSADASLVLQARAPRHVASPPTPVPMPPPDLVELKVARGRTLSGRVVTEAGEPLAGAQVSASQRVQRAMGGAVMMTAGRATSFAETDEGGGFLLEALPPGEAITLSASASGYQSQQLDVDLAERGEGVPVTVTLRRGLVVAGRVVDAAGAPRAGVRVECTSAAMARGAVGMFSFVPPVTTSADGRFRFEGVAEGRWQLVASDGEGGSAREVVEAGREDVVLRLVAAGELEGRVLGEDRTPVPGARVRVMAADEFQQATTDGTGTFRVPNLAPGMARVVVEAKGWGTGSEQVKIESGRTAQVELTLKRGGTVVGRVLGLSAEELGRCQVMAGGSRGEPDANGTFRLEGVATGSQVVRAFVLPDFKSRQATVTIPAAGAEVEVDLDFSSGVTLSGTVRRGGRPAPGVTVAAGPPGGRGVSTAVTDGDGTWRVTGLPEGELEVGVLNEHGALVARRQLTATGDTRVELEIPDGTLSGRVIGGRRREGIAGAAVRLEHEGKELRTLSTDEAGAFVARELSDGRYRLRAWATGWGPAEAEVTLSMGTARPVTLELKEEAALLLRLREADGTTPSRVYLLAARGGRVEEPAWVACDGEGRVRVSTLPPGEYLVHLASAGGRALLKMAVPSVETPVVLGKGGWLVVDAPAGSGAGWRARVVAPQWGSAVPFDPWMSPTRDGWVAVDGHTQLPLPAGSYVVEWVSPAGRQASAAVQVPPDGRVSVTLE